MIPGFVQLGVLAILFQVLVIAVFYRYVTWRLSTPPAGIQSRAKLVIGSGVALVVLGQLAGFGAISSLWTTTILSVRRVIFVQNIGFIVTLMGYVVVVAGFVLYSRGSG